MIQPNPLQQRILLLILQKRSLRSSQVHHALEGMQEQIALVTVKRMLHILVKAKLLSTSGAGRSVSYAITTHGRVLLDVDASAYCRKDPDERYGSTGFNFALFAEMPREIFTAAELLFLAKATDEFRRRTTNVSATIARKEMERFIIELSWKSSKIEGNTYTLLDTEKLILEHQEARGHERKEAQMILNHKDAFALIHAHPKDFRTLTRANVDHLHKEIVKNLDVTSGLRRSAVGITGSLYRPLDNIHQITDALQHLTGAVARMNNPYAKALLALLGISYVQPFEDGNKRTSRLMANALLLANGCAPLSYRSVNEDDYRDAILVFYELNSLVPFKKIFMEQYDFAARHYAVT